MKNAIYFLLAVLTCVTLGCSKDDDNNSSYPQDIEGTTWYRQETTTQFDQTIEVDFYLVFETSDSGYLEAETSSQGTNITDTYYFTYVYSQGSGTAEFEDSNIGTQDFTISGDKLTLDGETLTQQ